MATSSAASTSYTSRADFESSYTTLFKTFATQRTKSLAWRKWQLKQCWWLIDENEAAITEALRLDLNRHDLESYTTDIMGVKKTILEHIEHLEEWTADVKPNAGFLFGTVMKARLRREALGVGLIVSSAGYGCSPRCH